jgi:GTP:adenosylcobinamide-phosphate guanylyltransferase
MPAEAMRGIHAILLAGSRPERDRLAEAFGVPVKALVPIMGEPAVSRVARTLVDHPRIARLTILAQDPRQLFSYPGAEWLAGAPAIHFEQAGSSVSETLAAALERHPADYPFLVTTADHALLDGRMIDLFLDGAAGADVAVALVERATLLASYPTSRRTWLKFRGGAYSGANLFLFGSPRALKALAVWRRIEAQRKRARAVVGAFGPLILAGIALRILSLHQALRWAGSRLGVTARAVELPIAEACIDVDTPSDHALVEKILAGGEQPLAVNGTPGRRTEQDQAQN